MCDVFCQGDKWFYRRYLLPLLRPHQSVPSHQPLAEHGADCWCTRRRIWGVPGIFGNPHGNASQLAARDEELVEKLRNWVAWANEEPRIAGLQPWHWQNVAAEAGGPPMSMNLGASAYPKTLAAFAELRAAMNSSSASQNL